MKEVPSKLSLADLDREQATRFSLTPRFSDSIEALYCRYRYKSERRFIAISWLIGIMLFSSFGLSDYALHVDNFYGFMLMRLGVVAPLGGLIVLTIWRTDFCYDLTSCAVPFVMAAALSFMVAISTGAFRETYLFGNVMLMTCGCVISRPRSHYAWLMVMLQQGLFFSVLFLSDSVPPERHVLMTLFSISGGVIALLSAFSLESQSRRTFLSNRRSVLLYRELEVMATTDPLTGVANRRSAAQQIDRVWCDDRVRAEGIAVIMADIDYFKRLNDKMGHAAGDQCIQQVCDTIVGSVRSDRDIVSRHGGEEFMVVLAGANRELAMTIAERIRLRVQALALPNPDTEMGIVTLSLGIAFARESASPEVVVKCADEALYEAKNHGRNQVALAA